MTKEALPALPVDPGRDPVGLERAIGYTFRNEQLLREALTHPSCGRPVNYERLEFLGDAVLELAVSDTLFKSFPDAEEGWLTRRRASSVQTSALAAVAERLQLGQYLDVGRGEADAGRHKSTILENALEAVLGAVYLDSDFATALGVVQRVWQNGPEGEEKGAYAYKDAKTELQERVQAGLRVPIRYEVTDREGPPHDPTFCVALYLGQELAARGGGSSKKRAEQQAAARALEEYDRLEQRMAEKAPEG